MYIVVFTTAANRKEASKIARALLRKRLAACVNIVEGVQSMFWWEGKVDCASECLLMIKSKRSLFTKIEKAVRSLHSYEVPEIIALPLCAGEKRYLRWIDGVVRESR